MELFEVDTAPTTLVGLTPGVWYQPAGAIAATGGAAGYLFALPMLIPRATNFDRIGIRVRTAGGVGSLARLGVYYDNGNYFPGTLQFDAGTVVSDTLGTKIKVIARTIGPGVVWLATLDESVTSAPVLNSISTTTSVVVPPFGLQMVSAADFTTINVGFGKAAVAPGALPATWPGTTADVFQDIPLVSLRAA